MRFKCFLKKFIAQMTFELLCLKTRQNSGSSSNGWKSSSDQRRQNNSIFSKTLELTDCLKDAFSFYSV